MKKFLAVVFLFLVSCTTQPKAFRSSEEIKTLPMRDCKTVLDPYVKNGSIPFVQTGITQNRQAVYFIFANMEEGILIHFVNPGFDWTQDPSFKKAKYKGYCAHRDDEVKYFLIYEQRVPSKD